MASYENHICNSELLAEREGAQRGRGGVRGGLPVRGGRGGHLGAPVQQQQVQRQQQQLAGRGRGRGADTGARAGRGGRRGAAPVTVVAAAPVVAAPVVAAAARIVIDPRAIRRSIIV